MFVDMMRGQSDEVKLEVATYLLASVTNKAALAETPPPPPLSEEEKDQLFEKLAEDAARMEAAIKECRENDVLREVNMD